MLSQCAKSLLLMMPYFCQIVCQHNPKCLQVGELPVQSIPLRLQVAGSPLVITRERVLLQGMQQLQHQLQQQQQHSQASSPAAAAVGSAMASGAAVSAVDSSAGTTAPAAAAIGIGGSTALQLGLGIVPAGVAYERTFYVCNTGEHACCADCPT